MLLTVGLLWLRSSLGKLADGKFVEGLGTTLVKFAANNPYPWYKDFLNSVAIPNSYLFALLTMWGEFLTGLSLTLGALLLIFGKSNKLILIGLKSGLLGGMGLNLFFWLAAGWTSPSTDGLNLLMFVTQLIGFITLSKKA